MKKMEKTGNVYATNEAGLLKSPKGKPAQPNASVTKGNDLRVRTSQKKT